MILVEMVHDARVVRLGGTHVASNVRKWMGDSVGHWEGETLVVETTNFTDYESFRGTTPDARVIERFTRVAPDKIHYRFTVEDPQGVHAAVHRRVAVLSHGRSDLRIRLPRRQLRAARNSRRRARAGVSASSGIERCAIGDGMQMPLRSTGNFGSEVAALTAGARDSVAQDCASLLARARIQEIDGCCRGCCTCGGQGLPLQRSPLALDDDDSARTRFDAVQTSRISSTQ